MLLEEVVGAALLYSAISMAIIPSLALIISGPLDLQEKIWNEKY